MLERGQFILGPEVAAFEHEFAAYLGAEHAIGVANGTEAITVALRALGVGPGDEVVVPSFTFYASAEAIPPTGAKPVFCDVDPDTFCVTPETVQGGADAADEGRDRGPPVRQRGADRRDRGARRAGARGRRPGGGLDGARRAAGRAGHDRRPSRSTRPRTSGAFGDGGAVTTNDAALAERGAGRCASTARKDKVTYEQVGYNSRLDEIQAAILRIELPELDRWAGHRHDVGEWYAQAGLGELATLPQATDGAKPAWHLYVIRHERPDELKAALAARQVDASGYYRTPVHRQPAMAEWGNGVELPYTDELARTHLALPISAALTRGQVDEVVDAVRDAGLS